MEGERGYYWRVRAYPAKGETVEGGGEARQRSTWKQIRVVGGWDAGPQNAETLPDSVTVGSSVLEQRQAHSWGSLNICRVNE